jgi:hypothetical protein
LSRELCPAHAQTKALDNKTRYIFYNDIARNLDLQAQYPPLCEYCPLESKCTGTFSSGPHYEYGLLVLQKRFPYNANFLPGLNLADYIQPVRSRADRGARY